jgi:hypothetical protein
MSATAPTAARRLEQMLDRLHLDILERRVDAWVARTRAGAP